MHIDQRAPLSNVHPHILNNLHTNQCKLKKIYYERDLTKLDSFLNKLTSGNVRQVIHLLNAMLLSLFK